LELGDADGPSARYGCQVCQSPSAHLFRAKTADENNLDPKYFFGVHVFDIDLPIPIRPCSGHKLLISHGQLCPIGFGFVQQFTNS